MTKRFLTIALAFVMCQGIAMPAWAAENENLTEKDFVDLDSKYDAEFFNQLRLDVIEDELRDAGIEIDAQVLKTNLGKKISFDNFVKNDIKVYIQKSFLSNNEKEKLSNKVSTLSNIPVTYIDKDTLRVYNSKDGFVGYATPLSNKDNIESITSNTIPFSKSNPLPSEIFGGLSGAFERRQLGNQGFDKITSNITLPTISNFTDGEQPWVYYGFDPQMGTGIEGGFGYWPEYEINNKIEQDVWLAYISGDPYKYEVPLVSYKSGQTIGDINFLLKKQKSTDTFYSAFLLIGNDILICTETDFKLSDIKTMSVKRMTTIGKSGNNFNGNNIYTISKNQKFDKVQVRKYNENSYKSWGAYSEYSEWKSNQWYGTIDCIADYIHRNGAYVSIYK